ncbi:hypothetical protein HDU82_003610 [Entophlyctis luteolus]|nr:hypothetical protein HDU82_003610 [Entophlyctis luteolus]
MSPEAFSARAPRPMLRHLRAQLCGHVARQSVQLARLQRAVPAWAADAADALAVLGTHSFFLLVLPPLFFSPVPASPAADMKPLALSLVAVLALGVCLCAVVKDLLCLPRPFVSKGVVRRSKACSQTSLEYGFPSTHSANATSVAIVLCVANNSLVPLLYPLIMGISRLVVGMHSFMDVIGGWVIGGIIAGTWVSWFPFMHAMLIGDSSVYGAVLGDLNSSISGFFVVILACLVVPTLLHCHPNPTGPCPCFEDSVAFISVFAGMIYGYWRKFGSVAADAQYFDPSKSSCPSSYFKTTSVQLTDATAESMVWMLRLAWTMILRVVLGSLVIFLFRKVSKKFLVWLLRKTLPNNNVEARQRGENSAASIIEEEDDSVSKKPRPAHVIPRFTNAMVIDIILYFGIAVFAVDIIPRGFDYACI